MGLYAIPTIPRPSPPPNFTSFSHALNSITYVFCWVLHLKSWLFLASFVNVPNVPGTASVIPYSLLHFRISVRSSHQRHSIKKMFLEISQNSQEITCARASFLKEAWGLQLYLKRDSGTGVFQWILRNFEHLFYRTPLVAVSEVPLECQVREEF